MMRMRRMMYACIDYASSPVPIAGAPGARFNTFAGRPRPFGPQLANATREAASYFISVEPGQQLECVRSNQICSMSSPRCW